MYLNKLQMLEDALQETGETGETGDTWETGETGDKGEKGDTGLTGSWADWTDRADCANRDRDHTLKKLRKLLLKSETITESVIHLPDPLLKILAHLKSYWNSL